MVVNYGKNSGLWDLVSKSLYAHISAPSTIYQRQRLVLMFEIYGHPGRVKVQERTTIYTKLKAVCGCLLSGVFSKI